MTPDPIILILEDERSQILTLQAQLAGLGKLVEFMTPEPALKYARANRCDAAIVDVRLARSEMDGIAFLRALREFDKDLAIIIRTANDSDQIADRAIELRAIKRAVKSKTTLAELRHSTEQAIRETRERRETTQSAREAGVTKEKLAEALGGYDLRLAAADLHRGLVHQLRNQLTVLSALSSLLNADARRDGHAEFEEHARRSASLVGKMVDSVNAFLDGPFGVGSAAARAPVNLCLGALRQFFVGVERWSADNKTFGLRDLLSDTLVECAPLELLNGLRHLVEFFFLRAAAGGGDDARRRDRALDGPDGRAARVFRLRPEPRGDPPGPPLRDLPGLGRAAGGDDGGDPRRLRLRPRRRPDRQPACPGRRALGGPGRGVSGQAGLRGLHGRDGISGGAMSKAPSQEMPGGGDAWAHERLAAVAYIASLIGHEARGRLATLRAALELLQAGMEANLSAEYRASLLHEFDVFIGDFNVGLDMLRCDSTVMEPVSARELVLEAVGTIQPLAARSGISLTPFFRHSSDILLTDRRLLRVTLLNLLRNAIEALPGAAEPQIEVRVTGDAGWLQLEIADNGPGVPLDKREKLFLRLDKEGQAGAGFGLSICRDALLQLGGTISHVSPPGEPGACFRVRVPIGT